MTTNRDTNPPSRRDEDFPKTSTIPEGWVMDALMEKYNQPREAADRGTDPIPVPATGYMNGKANGKVNGKANGKANGAAHVEEQAEEEGLFTRRLNPNPSAWDLTGMYL